jgi:hypothetical protein
VFIIGNSSLCVTLPPKARLSEMLKACTNQQKEGDHENERTGAALAFVNRLRCWLAAICESYGGLGNMEKLAEVRPSGNGCERAKIRNLRDAANSDRWHYAGNK